MTPRRDVDFVKCQQKDKQRESVRDLVNSKQKPLTSSRVVNLLNYKDTPS